MKSMFEWLFGAIMGEDDEAGLRQAIAIIRRSEIGAGMLAEAEAKGYEIIIDHEAGQPYHDPRGTIGLQPMTPLEFLVGDLAHELAHLDQRKRLDFSPENLGRDDFMAFRRIIEADADAKTLAICDQIARAGDFAPFDALRVAKLRKDMTAAFYRRLDISDKSGSRHHLPLQDGFFAWFENPLRVNVYDVQSLTILAHVAQEHPEDMRKWGTEKLTAAAVRRIATLPGSTESYLPADDPRIEALLGPSTHDAPVSRNRRAPGC